MPIQELLKVIVFCHRIADDRDFTEQIICIPSSNRKIFEAELLKRQDEGEIDTVQTDAIYIQATEFTPYQDETSKFLAKLDQVRLHSSTERATPSEGEEDSPTLSGASNFTGFDDVTDSDS